MSREKPPTRLVLVVDDEALIRWSLSEALTEAGYAARMAASGAEARVALASFGRAPVVVLLDMRLPDVADLSLAREFRQKRPDAAVILMTAHGTLEDAKLALELGVFRFVSKPFDVPDMVKLVERAWASMQNSKE
jgi:DNA-binding NtrC family response regulator